MSFALRPLRPLTLSRSVRRIQGKQYVANNSVETDSCGIPLKPTWSVYELLSSYPKPTVSSATLERIHELSALKPPKDGTPEHEKLLQELGDLIKLVEAVKLVNTDGVQLTGRVYKKDWDRDLASIGKAVEGDTGQSLLKHASRTADGFYVVDAERKR
jgi:Asp-tRNA(Asn)/Glu-tRNA(Gln) amidotransferase C subunit